jgi:hypothetical protein
MITREQLQDMLVEEEELNLELQQKNEELTETLLELALELLEYKDDEIDKLQCVVDWYEADEGECICPECRAERELN